MDCVVSCLVNRDSPALFVAAASRVGIGFALAFIVGGLGVVAATHEPVYAWYAVLGGFLLRQGWVQERAARAPGPAAIERRDVEVGAAA